MAAAQLEGRPLPDFLELLVLRQLAENDRQKQSEFDDMRAKILAAGGAADDVASEDAMQRWLHADFLKHIGTISSGDTTGSETVKQRVQEYVKEKIERQRRENPGPD